MIIRPAKKQDLKTLYEIELITFPPAEAALAETFSYRFASFPDYFYVAMSDKNIPVAFLSGRPVDVADNQGISDLMYENAPFPEGDTFALLSVSTTPAFQRQGYGSALIHYAIKEASRLDCRRMILACKDEKIRFYRHLGFSLMGLSASSHGGALWYDMELIL